MKRFFCSSRTAATAFLAVSLTAAGCGFKLRTNVHTLINSGSKLYIAPITSTVFEGGAEELLTESLISSLHKKEGIEAAPAESADMRLMITITDYEAVSVNSVSGINTLRARAAADVTVIDNTPAPNRSFNFTAEQQTVKETAAANAGEAEKETARVQVFKALAEEIIRRVTVR